MALDGSTMPGGANAGQMYQRRRGSLWDAQLHPCKDSFALDFREYITPTCREGKLLHRKAAILHDEKALLWTGNGKLREHVRAQSSFHIPLMTCLR